VSTLWRVWDVAGRTPPPAVDRTDALSTLWRVLDVAGRTPPRAVDRTDAVLTLWRVLDVAGGRVEQAKTARALARRAVWAAGADPGFYVVDIDATLVDSHSNKQGAAGTYKRGFGFHPLMAYLDATGEALAGLLGSATPGPTPLQTTSRSLTTL